MQVDGFGTLADGGEVCRARLSNAGGIEVDAISYGGIITRMAVPDASGRSGNVVLGFDSLADYEADGAFVGALVGRYANRIAAGRLRLDGQLHQLDRNAGAHHLHGGAGGFHCRNWRMEPFETRASAGVVLSRLSPCGEQGYPGSLAVRVRYELFDDDRLEMDFEAETDAPTVVSMTHHGYFNLAGSGDILDHRLEIPASRFVVVDAEQLPTGEIRDVAGGPLDFRRPKRIGRDIDHDDPQLRFGRGYDHHFVLDRESPEAPALAARVTEAATGRVLEVYTTAPGLQFYSGNALAESAPSGAALRRRSAFCLEPQQFPDAPNHPVFPSARLQPGATYRSRIVYRFSTVDGGSSGGSRKAAADGML